VQPECLDPGGGRGIARFRPQHRQTARHAVPAERDPAMTGT
jgi:hypothetical protein